MSQTESKYTPKELEAYNEGYYLGLDVGSKEALKKCPEREYYFDGFGIKLKRKVVLFMVFFLLSFAIVVFLCTVALAAVGLVVIDNTTTSLLSDSYLNGARSFNIFVIIASSLASAGAIALLVTFIVYFVRSEQKKKNS